ncbi:twin-arginine translocation signal domain-containing protein, partial [Klebsiella pneumoniae]|uniref:twin-arginine translocation signal domain-containing protein n=1 Tax=Klebsiella pneumoniae TaxID=573 RepID=UPI00338DFD5B
LTRRDFLKGTAASALAVSALGVLGCANDAQSTTAASTASETEGMADSETVS